MYNEAKVLIFRTCVESKTSGTVVFTDENKIVNIKELHNAIKNGDYVVIENKPKGSETTYMQRFIMTNEIETEDGFENTYTFVYQGRLIDKAITRKIVMSFKTSGSENVLSATYFAS